LEHADQANDGREDQGRHDETRDVLRVDSDIHYNKKNNH